MRKDNICDYCNVSRQGHCLSIEELRDCYFYKGYVAIEERVKPTVRPVKGMPDKLKIFRRVGSDELHIGTEMETMSHGNSDGAQYIRNEPTVILEEIKKWYKESK